MNLIKDNYWNGTVFNGSEVIADSVGSLEKDFPYDDYNIVHKVKLPGMLSH